MGGTLHEIPRIRESLAGAIGAARRDGALFALLTVLLTPVFLAAAVAVILWAALYADLPGVSHYGFRFSFITGMNLALIWMFTAFFARPKGRGSLSDLVWVGLAVAAFAGILCLSYGTDLQVRRPQAFWPAYGALGVLMFGLLGHAYEPRDNYYLGWFGGWMDDPFTIEGDIDRAHLSLGFATAFPRLIVGSYGEIFGSSWLVRGLDREELSTAASVLHALGAGVPDRAEGLLRSARRPSAARVVRALAKLKLGRHDRGRLRLTGEGEKFVGVSEWL